jgi:hypothetical protein
MATCDGIHKLAPNCASWAKIGLQNFVYNVRRLVTLERMAAA